MTQQEEAELRKRVLTLERELIDMTSDRDDFEWELDRVSMELNTACDQIEDAKAAQTLLVEIRTLFEKKYIFAEMYHDDIEDLYKKINKIIGD